MTQTTMKKPLFIFILFFTVAQCTFAYDFKVNGMYYNITSFVAPYTVEVTKSHYNDPYTGNIVIPDTVTVTYGGNTYSVTAIGYDAFWYCSTLTSITIPNSVTTIGGFAFYGCNALTSVIISNSATTIGSYAFSGCNALTSIIIPNSVKTIEPYAFSNCSRLNSITMSDSVTTIGKGAFENCSALTFVIIPNSVTTIGSYAFQRCSQLDSIIIPNSVTTMGNNAFQYCSELRSITISNAITTIEYFTFDECISLTSITIPASVSSIDRLAFADCSSLEKIIVENNIPPTICNDTFFHIADTVPIYVPCGTMLIYQAADEWKRFTTIREKAQCCIVTGASNNTSFGSVTGSGTYEENSTTTLTAVPYAGSHFTKWHDGDTSNPRTITVTKDTLLVANFAEGEVGINNTGSENEVFIYPNPVQDKLTIRSSATIEQITIYDLNGKTVLSLHYPAQNINVSSLSKGLYMVKIKTEKGESRHKIVKE